MTTRRTGSRGIVKNVATAFSGTTASQAFSLAVLIPLARLYSPGDFGLFAIIQSVVAVGTTVASLRYDMAVVLPRSHAAARALQRLASRSILIVSLLLSIILLIMADWVQRQYGNGTFGYWLVASALIVYLAAQVSNIQFWLIRQEDYGAIAVNRVIGAVAVGAFQLLFAWIVGGFQGLFAGLLAGQLVAFVLISWRTPELRKALPAGAPTQWQMAKRYRKMPLLNGPNALLDSIKLAGINLLIGNIALGGLGQYSLAFRMTLAPVSLLNGAIAQVLLQKLATTERGSMTRLVRAVLVRIALFAVPVFVGAYFLTPALFPILFGSEWGEAGLLAQALIPWIFMLTFTSPLSSLFIATESQEWSLGFAIIATAAPLSFLALSPFPLLQSVSLLSWIMSGLLVLWVGMAFLVARKFDESSQLTV